MMAVGCILRMAAMDYRWIRTWLLLYWVLLECGLLEASLDPTPGLPTVTVRGFLNFKTTVDGTVIVFTPAAQSAEQPPSMRFEKKERDGGIQEMSERDSSPPQNFLETIKSHVPDFNVLDNKITDPFLPQISDNAVLPSTGQVNNDLEKMKKLEPSPNQYPTGLVTVLGGTFVEGSSTTVYETKVIGTYIDGKYAQILQSTSQIVSSIFSQSSVDNMQRKGHSDSSNTIRKEQSSESHFSTSQIIKPFQISSKVEAALKATKLTDSTSIASSEETKENQFSLVTKPSQISSNEETALKIIKVIESTPVLSFEKTTINQFSEVTKSSQITSREETAFETAKLIESTPVVSVEKTTESQFLEKRQSQVVNVIPTSAITRENNVTPINIFSQSEMKSSLITLESSFPSSPISILDAVDLPTETLDSAKRSSATRKFSTYIPVSSTALLYPDDDNAVPLTKVHRNSTSRTRFLSPRRQSQTVRLNRFKVKLTLRQDSADEYNVTLATDDEDIEEDVTHKDEDEMEHLSEATEISVDPARVVFQETTITSEVTLHVGRRKSVRTLTITTSIPLTVNPTDIQHILSSQPTALDISDVDLHVVTRTFTTTERALKTSIVPIFDGKATMYHTVTESFFIMKIITAYRTLPPGDPSVLESFLDESENVQTAHESTKLQSSLAHFASSDPTAAENIIQPSIILPQTTIQTEMKNPLLSLGHALSNNPLAAVYLGLQQFNAQMTLYSTITDTSTYVTTETFYNTKTIRFYDGRSTRYRMISDPTSTKKSTVTTTVVSLQPYINSHAIQQQQELQKLIAATQLNPIQPQFNTITSTYTTVTTATNLSTRIYTLIYNGFSTKFRTVTSSTLYPTTVVITTTTKLLITPTQVNLPFAYPYTSLAH